MRPQAKIPLIATVVIALAVTASAESIRIGGVDGLDPHGTEQSIPVALALSGGGARGLAAIGVLKALEENNISVAAVAGTSIGGIVGGLYACGYRADAIKQIVREIDYSTLFRNEPSRRSMLLTRRRDRDRHLLSMRFDGFRPQIPHALTSGQELASLLTSLTNKATYRAGGDFSRFTIPFKTVCTDIVSGEEVVLSDGSLADALRATMAFPLAFTGVDREDRWLMDGGMLVPVPVDIVRAMTDSVKFVLAVNCASALRTRDEIISPVDLADQVTTIMTVDKLMTQLSHADFVIQPTLGSIMSGDFAERDSIIDRGYAAAVAVMDSLKLMIRRQLDTTEMAIQRVSVVGDDDRFTSSAQSALSGRKFGRRALTEALQQLCRDNNLFQLDAGIVPDTIYPVSATKSVQAVVLTLTPRANLDDRTLRWVVNGNTVFDDSTLMAQVQGHDSIVTPEALRRRLDRIVNLYQVENYDLADIRATSIDFDHQVVTVDLDEAIVRRIDVSFNQRSRDWLVRSYFPLKAGAPYSTLQANRGLNDLYGTDLFDRVTVSLLPHDSGAIVDIGVRERKYTQARVGWHWDDTYQSEEFIEILDDNVAGIGMEYLLHARYSDDRQHYFAELKADRIFKTYLTAQLRLYHAMLDRTTFTPKGEPTGIREERETGAYLRIGQQIHRLGAVTVGLQFDKINLDGDQVGEFGSFNLRTLTFESLVENLDRVPFPNSGKRSLLDLRFAGKVSRR